MKGTINARSAGQRKTSAMISSLPKSLRRICLRTQVQSRFMRNTARRIIRRSVVGPRADTSACKRNFSVWNCCGWKKFCPKPRQMARITHPVRNDVVYLISDRQVQLTLEGCTTKASRSKCSTEYKASIVTEPRRD
jgi:hypothetical protein